ncbi:LytR/AlgR family response regulator transcription factor [Tenacibaculum sp. SDUM215027]|uniref:LytR/AlgR family response regulator transcription factor n=1 Tax=Tenacibaculum sp. SDUM215027 TaxID=3422596 RepID=UPI003D31CBAC
MAKKINCVIVDDEPIAREILESFVEKTPNLKLISSCKNAMEALQVSQMEAIDLFFLDINMPEITGLSLAKIINNK